MNALNPFFALLPLASVLLSSCLLTRWAPPAAAQRYASIDGLRGLLALFVFIHHAAIWYGYLRSGQWEAPPSQLFNHFGQSGVAFFFMITGFLFSARLLETRPVDWGRLYVSRLLRLAPLYCVVLALLFGLVAWLSDFERRDGWGSLAKDVLDWLLFTVRRAPDINGLHQTSLLIAAVSWSLPYEWLFYLALPLLAWAMGKPPSRRIRRLSLFLSLLVMVLLKVKLIYLGLFGGGVMAAYLLRKPGWRAWAVSTQASWLALLALGLAIAVFPGAFKWGAVALLACCFAPIACGNSLFGLLQRPTLRCLGEMAYGIYLLHGLLLFCLFHFVVGRAQAASWLPWQHWLAIAACGPVLAGLAFASFRLIEAPAMARVDALHGWLKARHRTPAQPA